MGHSYFIGLYKRCGLHAADATWRPEINYRRFRVQQLRVAVLVFNDPLRLSHARHNLRLLHLNNFSPAKPLLTSLEKLFWTRTTKRSCRTRKRAFNVYSRCRPKQPRFNRCCCCRCCCCV